MVIGGHHRPVYLSEEWFTPPEIIERLGPFDLDVCTSVNRPFDTAKKHYTKEEDGLICKWKGRVWCNPPYGRKAEEWLKRCSEYNRATVLIFARTETRMFQQYVWPYASALLFIRGRLHFYRENGERAKANAGGPSVLVAYGKQEAAVLRRSKIPGFYIDGMGVVSIG